MGRLNTNSIRIPVFVFIIFTGSMLVVLHSSQNTSYSREVKFQSVFDDGSKLSISSEQLDFLLNKAGVSSKLVEKFKSLQNGVHDVFEKKDDDNARQDIRSSFINPIKEPNDEMLEGHESQSHRQLTTKPTATTGRNTLTSMAERLNKLTHKVDAIYDELKHKETIKEDAKPKILSLRDIKTCHDTNVLFLVTSHSSNVKRRESIRSNWGNKDKFKVLKERFNLTYELYFAVGLGDSYTKNERIKQESRTYGDLLIVNQQEDFYDLTRRVMVTFEWAAESCHFEHLFKVDDDIFINIPNVFTFLANDTLNMTSLYAGDMNLEAPVNRRKSSKYSVSYQEWPAETYPPYCSGGGFIVSRAIVKSIVPYFEWSNPYKIDDVYIGILIHRAKMETVEYYFPEHQDMFWFYNKIDKCEYKSNSLVYHKVDNNNCMTKLTEKSMLNLTLALDKIDLIKNKPPPSLEELAMKVFVPSENNIEEPENSGVPEKIPRLEDMPRALPPYEGKKKYAKAYFAKLKQKIIEEKERFGL